MTSLLQQGRSLSPFPTWLKPSRTTRRFGQMLGPRPSCRTSLGAYLTVSHLPSSFFSMEEKDADVLSLCEQAQVPHSQWQKSRSNHCDRRNGGPQAGRVCTHTEALQLSADQKQVISQHSATMLVRWEAAAMGGQCICIIQRGQE